MEGQAEGSQIRLYEALIKGDVSSFLNLVEKDPMIVDRCVLENSLRCSFQSPLHVAAQMGHLEMVKSLLYVSPSMCLARDQDGRNPLHVAAIRGHIDVLKHLYFANPHAAKETMNGDETILHLCVKHYQLKALQILVELTDYDGDQLLNSKDTNGNTVLHLAVTSKQPEMVEYLLTKTRIEKNAINKNDMTSVDIHTKQSRKNVGDKKIKKALKHANTKRAKDTRNQQADDTWLEQQRTSLMVVASLIATMAFQVGINPPGGVWQDNDDGHSAGLSIWSSQNPDKAKYNAVQVCNTVALLSSLSVILLLISGFQFKRHFLSILRITLWITVTATTFTYFFAVVGLSDEIFNSDDLTGAVINLICFSIIGWIGLIVIIFLGKVASFILRLLGWERKEAIRKFFKKWFTRFHQSIITTTNGCSNRVSP